MAQFNQILELLKVSGCNIIRIPHSMDAKSQQAIRRALEQGRLTNDPGAAFDRLMTREYAYCITK